MLSGINLTVLMGRQVPRPISSELISALQSVEVSLADAERSGFQVVFQVAQQDHSSRGHRRWAGNPLFSVYNRVILVVTVAGSARVLMDGVITNQQLSPNPQPGLSTFTITGEDVSVMMDLEERSEAHACQDEATITRMILARYTRYGIAPKVIVPAFVDRPTKNERVPFQQGTDLAYLNEMAQRFAHVFHVTPGPGVGANTAYWGPPLKDSRPQKALSLNMGAWSNLASVAVENDALAATAVRGTVQDRRSNQVRPLREDRSDRHRLSRQSALQEQPHRRTTQFRQSGRETAQADALAQAITDRSVDDVVNVKGELDTVRYGDILQVRRAVALRGVGQPHDGLYYVRAVTHTLKPGSYGQRFTLSREGTGSTVHKVRL
jgi:hypothetical protein